MKMSRWRATAGMVLALGLIVLPNLGADQKLDKAITKAFEKLSKGRPEEAVKTLKKAVSKAEQDPEAHQALADLYLRLGEHQDDARASLDKAVEVAGPGAPLADALARRVHFELRTGSGKKALETAQRAVKAASNAESLAALARAQARLQDPGALAAADKAVAAGAGSALAHVARGEALLAEGRADDAVAAFRKAQQLDAGSVLAGTGLARALLAQGHPDQAAAEARKVTEADSQAGEAFAVLGLALLEQNPQQNWTEAISQAQQGVFVSKTNGPVHVAVGRIFAAASNYGQAQQSFQRALKADPSLVDARTQLVQVLVRQDQTDRALAEVTRLVQEVPESSEANLILGRLLLQKGKIEEAVGPLEKGVRAARDSHEAHAMLGAAYQRVGEVDGAVIAYERATELAPDNTTYRMTYGYLLGLAGRFEEGIAQLLRVTGSPDYKKADAFINLGWIYRSMDERQPDKAVAAYSRALQLDPKSIQAAIGVGLSQFLARSLPEAITAFEKAITLNGKTKGFALYSIARCHYLNRDMEQARVFLSQAAAAGQSDFGGLKGKIQKYENAKEEFRQKLIEQAKAAAARDLEEVASLPTLVQRLKTGRVGTKRQAARALRKHGAEAVPHLASVLYRDPNISVKEEIVKTLGTMGCKAKGAIDIMHRMVIDVEPPDPEAPPEKLALEMREGDLRRDMSRLIAKLKGC